MYLTGKEWGDPTLSHYILQEVMMWLHRRKKDAYINLTEQFDRT